MRAFGWMLLTVLVGSASTAAGQAASVVTIFEKYNLLGTWALDCGRPPGGGNWYFVNRALGTQVQRDFMISPTERQWAAVFDRATALGPTDVSIAGKITGRIGGANHDGLPAEGVWRVEQNRMLNWSAVVGGKPIYANGKDLSTGKTNPWINRCSGP